MINRTCLLIDDEKQDDIFPLIIQEGIRNNINIECLQLNVGNQEHREFLENEEVSLEKVAQVFEDQFKGKRIHLIAFDWNIGSGIKGTEIIKFFNDHNIRKNVPKLLYSGALKEEVEKLFLSHKKSDKFKKAWTAINTLLRTNALSFEQRENYEIGIVEQLRKIDDSIEGCIEDELRKYPDFKFNFPFPYKNLEGKKFSEICTMIEGDSNFRNAFTKAITEQVIAYLTEKI